jgi:glutamine---fructose-6-phosphate transaminase (isomerizing)
MCGIVAAIAQRNIVSILTDGLSKLEYRGYDSAGIAVIRDESGGSAAENTVIQTVRRTGRVGQLVAQIAADNIIGTRGIGHTRWATHGGVTEANAHPHTSNENIAVVHNGIIENAGYHKAILMAQGYVFSSQTDTEVIAHLIDACYRNSKNLFIATQQAVAQLEGAYAIAVLCRDEPNTITCARRGCPLLIGVGKMGENFIASDASAIIAETDTVIYLEEGDVACVTEALVQIVDAQAQPVTRARVTLDVAAEDGALGVYQHYMQKEIHEQPRAAADTLAPWIAENAGLPLTDAQLGAGAAAILRNAPAVLILASGSSYLAGLVAKYWIEALAGVACHVEYGHEYRYRQSVANPQQLVIAISQSGETLDTLEAVKRAKQLGHAHILALCNVSQSAIPRASSIVYLTRAGKEIGVASTKAFVTQLCALFTLSLMLGRERGMLSTAQLQEYAAQLRTLPGSLQHALNLEPQIMLWAERFAKKDHALFLGRGAHYPIAQEGALKLKEITYIHAEAYAAGELKHGPLALVDAQMPVVVIAPNDALIEKLKSNMSEVSARGGELFVFADADSHFEEALGVHVIRTPRHLGILSPIVHSVPVQLLAYHTALQRGTDVDKPRNLAKSVTVE